MALGQQSDVDLRFCIDYANINSLIVRLTYPFKETWNLLWKVTIYTKFDINWTYNLLQFKEGDEYNLAFHMNYGLLE